MKPTIWIYGGVHNEPGSRQRFLEELSKQKTPPHFVAVEWEQSLFERIATWRPWVVAAGLEYRWNFLTHQECQELSCALAWEGDAHEQCFPGAAVLWLESKLRELELIQRCQTDAEAIPRSHAHSLLQRLYCHPTPFSDPLPEPRSKKELVDRVWKEMWAEARLSPKNFARDSEWTNTICESSADLCDGWIAVVVGWAHADPAIESQQLRSLLLSEGFSVNSVYLGP